MVVHSRYLIAHCARSRDTRSRRVITDSLIQPRPVRSVAAFTNSQAISGAQHGSEPWSVSTFLVATRLRRWRGPSVATGWRTPHLGHCLGFETRGTQVPPQILQV